MNSENTTDNRAIDGLTLAEACGDEMYQKDHAAKALGVSLREIGPGYARMTMTVRDDMLNSHAMCHGGMIFALADCAFAYSCNGRNQVTVAAGCSIDYINPARAGDNLVAVARERSLERRTGIYDVTVTNQDNTIIAHFRGRSHCIGGDVVPELGSGN
ncbi:MAG: hydroxyphenylacetyl-CoA thioesterase PaaI [Gammaproteobacteria bacterium]|nr:MAG: hydroxyphenylacetyl-CoA thioesterase PaaI [Gammaproteobacteria bacterium]